MSHAQGDAATRASPATSSQYQATVQSSLTSTLPKAGVDSGTGAAGSAGAKLRSCVVCRSRKVRCDKQSPCSNCRRANIPCVVPSNDRPPRWARRLERLTSGPQTLAPRKIQSAASDPPTLAPSNLLPSAVPAATGPVMARLRSLEGLVKELSQQLELANSAATSSSRGASSDQSLPDYMRDSVPEGEGHALQEDLGKLVLQDENRTHYISSGFWSRVSDEVRASCLLCSRHFIPVGCVSVSMHSFLVVTHLSTLMNSF